MRVTDFITEGGEGSGPNHQEVTITKDGKSKVVKKIAAKIFTDAGWKVEEGIAATTYNEDDFDAKGLEGKALMQLYKDNEHNNQHSENNLLLAKAFGTPKEVKMVELIIAKNRQQGYTDTMDGEWMYHNINKKYYPQLVKGALGESYGIIVGMDSEDKDEQDNKTKAQVKNKKPYTRTESIFDE